MIAGESLPTLETPRVRLRWLAASDVEALFRIFSDGPMMRYW
jgi:ribosomal-protein-alanine N-acetyltransferase